MEKKWVDTFWSERVQGSDNDQLSIKSLMEPRFADNKPTEPQAYVAGCANTQPPPRAGQTVGAAPTPVGRYGDSLDRGGPAQPSPGFPTPNPSPVQSAAVPHQDKEPAQMFDDACQNTLSALGQLSVPPADAPSRQDIRLDLEPFLPTAVREQYTGSIERLETNIYGIAGAVSSLDGIDQQLLTAKDQIHKLRLRGEPIDYAKVKRVLEEMGQAISEVIDDLDHAEVNLLRDAKVKIAFKEVGPYAKPARDVDLNLISLEKLIKLSRTLENDPQQIDRFIGALIRALDSNIQVLSSLMLTLFAARDYTNSVTEIALEAGVMKRLTDARKRVTHDSPTVPPRVSEESKLSCSARQEPACKANGDKSLLQLLQTPARNI